MNPFRFGLARAVADDRSNWIEHVRHAESTGYATLHVADHIGALDPFLALQAAADVSTTLRLGTYVVNNDFYNPLLLARQVATLDLLSGGRVDLGLGAGWNVPEYEAAGIPFDRALTRIERLEEAVTILRLLFNGEPVDYDGEHYSISEAEFRPAPPQGRDLPIAIGGNGERLLAVAARRADVVAFTGFTIRRDGPDPTHFTREGLRNRIEHVRAEAGTRFAGLDLNVLVQRVQVTDDREAAAAAIATEWQDDGRLASTEDLLDSPFMLLGTVDEIAGQLESYRDDLGVAYYTVFAGRSEGFDAVVQRLAGS